MLGWLCFPPIAHHDRRVIEHYLPHDVHQIPLVVHPYLLLKHRLYVFQHRLEHQQCLALLPLDFARLVPHPLQISQRIL
ncbi:Uncharacterised protein [Vibrio cholerae]|uniref:Uncharacterized protein n=1 Tax=Vibrio cholerae TaxID=666 RepID=A0A655XWZ1_VIBCL|nr:Uncharacterised protein [Vibrio cholerae]CSB23136.1 Uncharacterised protein [Vibrio cholerae]CSB81900.1 Uncharacterised protein [Vibrio cholerae]CSC08172.1 Uncharacterised protein [Vibrio cholerae]CSC22986.1 Uncharacterised protein [Vibrio cholerae]